MATNVSKVYAQDVALFMEALARFGSINCRVVMDISNLRTHRNRGKVPSLMSAIMYGLRSRYFAYINGSVGAMTHKTRLIQMQSLKNARNFIASDWENETHITLHTADFSDAYSQLSFAPDGNARVLVSLVPRMFSRDRPVVLPITRKGQTRNDIYVNETACDLFLRCLFIAKDPGTWQTYTPRDALEKAFLTNLSQLYTDLHAAALAEPSDLSASYIHVDPNVIAPFLDLAHRIADKSDHGKSTWQVIRARNDVIRKMGCFYIEYMKSFIGNDMEWRSYKTVLEFTDYIEDKWGIEQLLLRDTLQQRTTKWIQSQTRESPATDRHDGFDAGSLCAGGVSMFVNIDRFLRNKSHEEICDMISLLDGQFTDAMILLHLYTVAVRRLFALEILSVVI